MDKYNLIFLTIITLIPLTFIFILVYKEFKKAYIKRTFKTGDTIKIKGYQGTCTVDSYSDDYFWFTYRYADRFSPCGKAKYSDVEVSPVKDFIKRITDKYEIIREE